MNKSDAAVYVLNVFFMALWLGPTALSLICYASTERSGAAGAFILGVSIANVLSATAAAVLRSIGFIFPELLRQSASLAGALVLLWIGTRLVLTSTKTTYRDFVGKETFVEHEINRNISPFWAGLAIHLANPYTTIFYTSTFLSIVPLDNHYTQNVLLLGAYAVVVDIVVLSVYGHFVSFFRLATNNEKSRTLRKFLNTTPIIAGCCLIFIASSSVARNTPKVWNAVRVKQSYVMRGDYYAKIVERLCRHIC